MVLFSTFLISYRSLYLFFNTLGTITIPKDDLARTLWYNQVALGLQLILIINRVIFRVQVQHKIEESRAYLCFFDPNTIAVTSLDFLHLHPGQILFLTIKYLLYLYLSPRKKL